MERPHATSPNITIETVSLSGGIRQGRRHDYQVEGGLIVMACKVHEIFLAYLIYPEF